MFSAAERRAVGEIARAEGIGPEAHVLAITQVESNGVIFANVDGRQEPLIRLEGHIYYRRLSGAARDRAVAAGLAHPKAGRVKNPRSQKARWDLLHRAMAIDAQAALESCSYGVGQVMGFHWAALGYASVQAFVAKAREGLAGQVELMLRFIRVNHLDDELEAGQWAAFARGYNGPAYRTNRYDVKMRQAADLFGGRAAANDDTLLRMGSKGHCVREVQALLVRAGYSLKVDGDFGPSTKAVLAAFQRANGLAVDGIYGPQTEGKLGEHRQAANDNPGHVDFADIAEVKAGGATAVGSVVSLQVAKSTLEQAASQIAGAGVQSVLIDYAVSGLTIAAGLVAVAGLGYAAWGWVRSQRTLEA